MKYPVILKYTFSYICSGNFYKPAASEYYQLFKNINDSRMVSINSAVYDNVDLEKYSDTEINFSYKYSRYLHPGSFVSDTECIEEAYTLKPGEKVSIICVYKYWAYANGAENGPATLTVEWISYENFIKELMEKSKESKHNASDAASALIEEGMYDIAFNMLVGTEKHSYELGLCYEKGYGTEVDLDKALENYLYAFSYACQGGIERIFKARGREIKYDKIKETMLYLSLGDYFNAYSSADIPTEISDNSLEDMRSNVELKVIKFLEEGRPFNDPYGNPTDVMCNLATYYDLINNVPEDEKPQYHTIELEDDPYDGGSFKHNIYHNELIVETLKKEAKKNDVIALGCLLVQFGIHPIDSDFSSYLLDNIEEIMKRLVDIAENGNNKDSGMAYYFLGLYYEGIAKKAKNNFGYDYYVRDKKYTYTGDCIEKDLEEYLQENDIAKEKTLLKMVKKLYDIHNSPLIKENEVHLKKLENFIIYLFNKNYENFSKIKNENTDIANKYFDLSLEKGFHLAIAHISENISGNYSKEEALKMLEIHEKFIPKDIRFSCADEYHKLLKKLRGN